MLLKCIVIINYLFLHYLFILQLFFGKNIIIHRIQLDRNYGWIVYEMYKATNMN